ASLTSLGAGLARAAAQSTSAGSPAAASMIGVKFEPRERVRLGLVGAGGRGSFLLNNFLPRGKNEVGAPGGIRREKKGANQETVAKSGQTVQPEIYAGSDHAFENLAKRDDLDLVIVATSWDFHVPNATFCMNQGKHVALEVPAARTLDECWALVNTSEKTR